MSMRRLRMRAAQGMVSLCPPLRSRIVCYRQTRLLEDHGEARIDEVSEDFLLSPDEQAFLMESAGYRAWSSPTDPIERRTSLTTVTDVTLLGDTGAIVCEQDQVLLTKHGRLGPIHHNDFLGKPLTPVPKRGGPPALALIGCGSGYRNLYHFLVERLPQLYYAADRFGLFDGGELQVLVNENPTPFQRDCFAYLEKAHPNLTFCEVPPGERWQFDRLHVIDNWQNYGRAAMPPEATAFIRDLYLSAYGFTPNKPSRRIWVSRSDAKHRRLKNEEELHPILEKHGFEIFVPGAHGFEEQVRTFAEAQIVAGPHGAAFTHLIFVPDSTPLLEIFASDDLRNMYFLMAKSQGHPYQKLVGSKSGRRDHFTVSPAALDEALTESIAKLS